MNFLLVLGLNLIVFLPIVILRWEITNLKFILGNLKVYNPGNRPRKNETPFVGFFPPFFGFFPFGFLSFFGFFPLPPFFGFFPLPPFFGFFPLPLLLWFLSFTALLWFLSF